MGVCGQYVLMQTLFMNRIEDFMKKVAIITNYNNILKSEFSIENLQYIMTVKGMLKK